MKACMCSLAGTRACDSCSNGPSRFWNQPLIVPTSYKKKPIKMTWSVTSLSD